MPERPPKDFPRQKNQLPSRPNLARMEGPCRGGPWDGQMFAHWERVCKIYRPMAAVSGSMRNPENDPIVPIVIGEYRLNDYNEWHWWETEAGKAMTTLFGEPK